MSESVVDMDYPSNTTAAMNTPPVASPPPVGPKTNSTQMSTVNGRPCYKKKDECPKGHEMEPCKTAEGETGRTCKQCGSLSFQPNTNRFGDQCRMRKTCSKYRMKYKEYGSTTEDAQCECEDGYHFENEDQRACVPNKKCNRGYGQGLFGVCEKCIDKNMWSNTEDTYSRCIPLRNCEKESRCTVGKSDGTYNNKCGPVVSDVTNCDSIAFTQSPPANDGMSAGAIAGLICGIGGVVILLLLLCVFCRRRKYRQASKVTREELDSLLQEIIKRSKKDELYCKKVLTLSQKEVEDRIDRQIWQLPQQLFRDHIEPAKYEVMVEKYKEQHHKFAINGYMQDWRAWKGDTAGAVADLMKCLETVKREDIKYEIINKLRDDYSSVETGYGEGNTRSSKPSSIDGFCAAIFPCVCGNDYEATYDNKESSSKLLDAPAGGERPCNLKLTIDKSDPKFNNDGGVSSADAGVYFRHAPTPSAPAIQEDERTEDVPPHFYDRSESLPITLPIQCST